MPNEGRNDVTLGGLTWTSDFDGGNLGRIEQRGENAFTVWSRADCEGTPQQTKSRTWFSFSVRGAAPGRELAIDVVMSPQKKLYEHGMRPVFRSLPSQAKWTRVLKSTPCMSTADGFTIQLRHTVDAPPDETLYFAFCYPYTYGDCMARLAWLDTLFAQPPARLDPGKLSEPPPPMWTHALEQLNLAERQRPPELYVEPASFSYDKEDTDDVAFRDVLIEVARKAALQSSASGDTANALVSSHQAGSGAGATMPPAAAPAYTPASSPASAPPIGAAPTIAPAAAPASAPTAAVAAANSTAPANLLPPIVDGPMPAAQNALLTTRPPAATALLPESPLPPGLPPVGLPPVTTQGTALTPNAARANAEIAAAAAREAAATFPHIRPRGNLAPGDGYPNASLVYYKRELLTRSLQGRRIDLITLTGNPHPPPCHPDVPPPAHRKQVVLLSARVHPGETPASYVIEGAIQFLLRADDPRAMALRKRYVFKFIPMLNPDGVYLGHYRSDTRGVNLNRMYSRPKDDLHPGATAVMQLVRRTYASGDLVVYVDVHAHAGRRGCFFYGCEQETVEGRVESQLFAKLVSLNTRWFDYDGCNWFSAEGQDGSARSAVYAATAQQGSGLPFVYTLECNYDSGVAMNELVPRHATGRVSGRLSPEPPRLNTTMGPKYCPESWQDIGKAILLAALDMSEANPHSRIGPLAGNGLERLRSSVASALAKWEKVKRAPRPPKEGDSAGEEDDLSSAYETGDEGE